MSWFTKGHKQVIPDPWIQSRCPNSHSSLLPFTSKAYHYLNNGLIPLLQTDCMRLFCSNTDGKTWSTLTVIITVCWKHSSKNRSNLQTKGLIYLLECTYLIILKYSRFLINFHKGLVPLWTNMVLNIRWLQFSVDSWNKTCLYKAASDITGKAETHIQFVE